MCAQYVVAYGEESRWQAIWIVATFTNRGQISHVLTLEGTIDPTVTFSVTLTHSS